MERSLNSTEPPAVPAASAARAGRIPDPRPARGRGARPRVPKTLLVLGVLMQRLTDVATPSPVHDGLADLQELEQNSSKGLCPEGQYLKENGDCKPCTDGIDFTDYPNDLPSCRPCRKCKLGCWRRHSECVNSQTSTTMNSQTSSSTSGSHNSTVSPAVEAPEGSAEAESSPTGGEFQEIEMTLIRDIHEPSPTEQAAFLQSRIPD